MWGVGLAVEATLNPKPKPGSCLEATGRSGILGPHWRPKLSGVSARWKGSKRDQKQLRREPPPMWGAWHCLDL